jgi:DNA-binding winged helix-turn-helix (wHTH) protein
MARNQKEQINSGKIKTAKRNGFKNMVKIETTAEKQINNSDNSKQDKIREFYSRRKLSFLS